MSEIFEEKKPKTPNYIRKASRNYYNKLKSDPVKYAEYCEKKRNYQRDYYHRKKKEKIERNKQLANSISNHKKNNQETTGQNEEPKGVIIVL